MPAAGTGERKAGVAPWIGSGGRGEFVFDLFEFMRRVKRQDDSFVADGEFEDLGGVDLLDGREGRFIAQFFEFRE